MHATLSNPLASSLTSPVHQEVDPDPAETIEWHESFHSLVATQGPQRAAFILQELQNLATQMRVSWRAPLGTPYINTISVDQQPAFPGNLRLEEKLGALMRWNALAMVIRANAAYGDLGGHIASYASAADLFEVGFNHFFHARQNLPGGHGGDLVFFQPHSAPGVYARAYLEGRFTEQDLSHYRQELKGPRTGAQGLCSYPHPYLMPDFWQFPTGSMGIGPISSIYQARFMRYLSHRNLLDCSGRKVWGVFGDGEMDEPESVAALTLAAREGLDNLVWVINCNLQRLDGPVRGNSRVIDEFEALFIGAGWNVIKVLWGSKWDSLFARDHSGALVRALSSTVDGQMQTFSAKDAAYNREHFFNQNSELRRLVSGMSDEEIDDLLRGGHDLVKVHAAYASAAQHQGQPTVILAHTQKGYGMGKAGQGRMTTHSQKQLQEQDLLDFRDRFDLPLTNEQAINVEFYKPTPDSPEMSYLQARRQALGGYLPARQTLAPTLAVPELARYGQFALTPAGRKMSSTMAFVRLLGGLLKDTTLGPRVVPIVADEARTFGMASLFHQVGIYSSVGQRYEPEDIGSILSYREAVDGQILEEGISEAGAMSSWTAAATSYSVHGLPMLPFYIYYSMFGFQRVGDLIWAAADQRPRGFLIGATSGRTTLSGEGLQHQDGSSHLMASTIPNCKSYDPAFAGELAVIVDHGAREMLEEQRDVFYYITVTNESYEQPDLPQGVTDDVLRGAYYFGGYQPGQTVAQPKLVAADGGAIAHHQRVTLLGSGAILTEVIKAAQELATMGIASDVVSVTSWSELARDGQKSQHAFITELLEGCAGPIIAATDYVRLVPESIRAYVPPQRRYTALGTDGFGRSDTRAELRAFFGVDAQSIVQAALTSLKSD